MSDISDFGDDFVSPSSSGGGLFQDVGTVSDGSPLLTAPTPAIMPSNPSDPLGSIGTDLTNLLGVVTKGQVAQTQAKSAASIAASQAAAAQAQAANPFGAISPTILLAGGAILVMVMLMGKETQPPVQSVVTRRGK
jgi:hypothetical protein